MKRMLFNATHQEELRVAIVDGQKLINIDIETAGKEQRKGNIYKGVITHIESSLEACFVSYGYDRHGFLPFKEVARSYFKEGVDPRNCKISDALEVGQELIVQVEKEERGNKGAALTTFVSLAGRYLVLMPNNPRGGGVSRRIEGEDRQELRENMDQLNLPSGMSIIARTAGIGRTVEELQWDLSYLLQLWKAIDSAAKQYKAPILIYQESSLVIRAIRDHFSPDIAEILIDTDEITSQVSAFMQDVMPDNLPRVKRYNEDTPLFSRFQIEHQIESAYARSVQLPSGGSIVIDHTEALTAVDVNSARSTRGGDIEETALRTNIEAAEEVARQMRLRDLGGLIVIDFIDMNESRNQREVEQTLRDALKIDRARVQMGKISRFGLMEMSRQRLRPSLSEGSHITCPRCSGTGSIRDVDSSALNVLRLIQEEAMKENTAAIHVQVPVEVATFLMNEKRNDIVKIEHLLKTQVVIIPNKFLETPHYDIERLRYDDARLDEPQASNELIQAPDTKVRYDRQKKQAQVARPEAVVKQVRRDTPAPVVSEKDRKRARGESVGIFGKIWQFIKSIFEDEKTEKKDEGRGQRGRRKGAQAGRGNGRRGQGKGEGRETRGARGNREEREGREGREGGRGSRRGPAHKANVAQLSPKEIAENAKKAENLKGRKGKGDTRADEAPEAVNAQEASQQEEQNNRRRRSRSRRRRRGEDGAVDNRQERNQNVQNEQGAQNEGQEAQEAKAQEPAQQAASAPVSQPEAASVEAQNVAPQEEGAEEGSRRSRRGRRGRGQRQEQDQANSYAVSFSFGEEAPMDEEHHHTAFKTVEDMLAEEAQAAQLPEGAEDDVLTISGSVDDAQDLLDDMVFSYKEDGVDKHVSLESLEDVTVLFKVFNIEMPEGTDAENLTADTTLQIMRQWALNVVASTPEEKEVFQEIVDVLAEKVAEQPDTSSMDVARTFIKSWASHTIDQMTEDEALFLAQEASEASAAEAAADEVVAEAVVAQAQADEADVADVASPATEAEAAAEAVVAEAAVAQAQAEEEEQAMIQSAMREDAAMPAPVPETKEDLKAYLDAANAAVEAANAPASAAPKRLSAEDIANLDAVATASGLQWVHTDPAKVVAVEPVAPKLGRPRPPKAEAVMVDMIQVETKA